MGKGTDPGDNVSGRITGKVQVADSGAIQLVPGYNYVEAHRQQSPTVKSTDNRGRKGNAPGASSSRGARGE